jgi:hypothetical protein
MIRFPNLNCYEIDGSRFLQEHLTQGPRWHVLGDLPFLFPGPGFLYCLLLMALVSAVVIFGSDSNFT